MRYNGGMTTSGRIARIASAILLILIAILFIWGGTRWILREMRKSQEPAKTEIFDDQSRDKSLKDANDEWCETHPANCKD